MNPSSGAAGEQGAETHPAGAKPLSRRAPLGLIRLAVLIAGSERRRAQDEEWRSHLSGETGVGLPKARQLRAAAGFVRAAVRYRWQDASDRYGKVADKVLASRRWSGTVTWLPTMSAAVVLFRHGGLTGVLANFDSLASLYGSLFFAIRLGRERREVQPQPRKPARDARE